MVRLRMKKMGRRNRAFFRICAFDAREERDGRSIEQLGTYDPMEKEESKKVVLKRERIEYWLSVGAQPSETVASILKKNNIAVKK
ncbi:MAG: 30S ribosomal protein S16 [Planctomycetes bacterium GWA2_40_7]|nr:MAG: 30S ribosomal protein S16 [Planctomycetes bacterium GWA2_40_7]OHB86980.1 MAG: 30S ribosomal protein S16 [Planctomycetes bacterium RIFCSPHIGHO2_02_FULL_40_12]OHC04608.1 MAG: 30S ribosomal protein S16 [Planctomycetes bacterium RIFCSPLOWO2_12_FULL_40_19]